MVAGSVLVVDDDWWVAELLEGLLREARSVVPSARDGGDALASVQLDPPDLVLSDVWMSGLDGPGLARQLRDRGRDVPVLLFSDQRGALPLVNLPGVRCVPQLFVPYQLVAAVEETFAPA